ncbi:extracellular solute-binding protein [Yoonia sp.]|uniref:extracellular solute-binding protein n=1 Tax=Yoonia sp. TaxID=2212373 RepID=UPI002FDA78CD
MMTRPIAGAAACALIAGAANAEELHIFTWADYFAADTVSNFEAETGIDVVLTYFDSVPVMETRLLTGGSGFDVVLSAASSVERFVTSDLLLDLNELDLANTGNLDPVILARAAEYDAGGFYSMPYMWGATGFAFNPAILEERLPGVDMSDLANFYDPEVMAALADCGVAIIDSPNEVIGMTLNYLGHFHGTDDSAQVNEALDLLTGIRPHIRYINSVKNIDDLSSGEICAAFTYSGDAAVANWTALEADNGIEIEFVIPQQGTGLWIDVWNVMADAPNPDGAAAFLDYLMRPEVIADITNTVYYANANAASKEFVSEDILNDPALYPTDEVVANLYPSMTLPNAAQRLRTRAWTTFTTSQ